eukprot:6273788-Prymnesium_polylepis.1
MRVVLRGDAVIRRRHQLLRLEAEAVAEQQQALAEQLLHHDQPEDVVERGEPRSLVVARRAVGQLERPPQLTRRRVDQACAHLFLEPVLVDA